MTPDECLAPRPPPVLPLVLSAYLSPWNDAPILLLPCLVMRHSALVFGAIFWRIKRSQSSVQDRMGLLQVGGRVGRWAGSARCVSGV